MAAISRKRSCPESNFNGNSYGDVLLQQHGGIASQSVASQLLEMINFKTEQEASRLRNSHAVAGSGYVDTLPFDCSYSLGPTIVHDFPPSTTGRYAAEDLHDIIMAGSMKVSQDIGGMGCSRHHSECYSSATLPLNQASNLETLDELHEVLFKEDSQYGLPSSLRPNTNPYSEHWSEGSEVGGARANLDQVNLEMAQQLEDMNRHFHPAQRNMMEGCAEPSSLQVAYTLDTTNVPYSLQTGGLDVESFPEIFCVTESSESSSRLLQAQNGSNVLSPPMSPRRRLTVNIRSSILDQSTDAEDYSPSYSPTLPHSPNNNLLYFAEGNSVFDGIVDGNLLINNQFNAACSLAGEETHLAQHGQEVQPAAAESQLGVLPGESVLVSSSPGAGRPCHVPDYSSAHLHVPSSPKDPFSLQSSYISSDEGANVPFQEVRHHEDGGKECVSADEGGQGVKEEDTRADDVPLELLKEVPLRLPVNDMEKILMTCAEAIESNNLQTAHNLMQALTAMVSPHGTAGQRMAYYFLEGLAARIVGTGSSIYQALQSKTGTGPGPASKDMLAALLAFLEACPYGSFGHVAANGAILEAVEGEASVHIIDFGITHGTQWPTLIEALAVRPGGPPHLRITGIDAPQTGLKPSSLQETGRRLSSFARLMGVPFEFTPVTEKLENLSAEQFDLRPQEALAVSCVLRLHQLAGDSMQLEQESARNRTLKMIRAMNPRLVVSQRSISTSARSSTLEEEEEEEVLAACVARGVTCINHAEHNLPLFKSRFSEAIHYYSALFDSLEVALPWHSTERVLIEERVLGRKVINIVACEGRERVERHESLARWRYRMAAAGFEGQLFSADVVDNLQSLLKRYREGYELDEHLSAVMLRWKGQPLLAASSWRCAGLPGVVGV
eukprot:jgi/Mesen1/2046/ME000149S01039